MSTGVLCLSKKTQFCLFQVTFFLLLFPLKKKPKYLHRFLVIMQKKKKEGTETEEKRERSSG